MIEIPLYPNYHLRKPDSFDNIQLRWEFIKENKKVRNQEKKRKKNSTRKSIKKTRKRPRKKEKTFFFS